MISLILVDYNSIEQSVEFILQAQQNIVNGGVINAVIVDNSPMSQDAFLREKFGTPTKTDVDGRSALLFDTQNGKIAYWYANDNLGYAKGNNAGAKIADALFAPEYYIISNNDVEFLQPLDWGEVQGIFENNPAAAVIGPQLKYPDGHNEGPFLELSPFRLLLGMYWSCGPIQFALRESTDRESGPCYCTCGCFLIAHKARFWKVDGFDSHTFMYYEENILAERLRKEALTFYYWKEYLVYHNHITTRNTSTKQGDEWAKESAEYYLENYLSASPFMMWFFRLSYRVFKIRNAVLAPIKKLIHWDELKKKMGW